MDIEIDISDDGYNGNDIPDIETPDDVDLGDGQMVKGLDGIWAYTVTFYPRHGSTQVKYIPALCGLITGSVGFNMYIDPAGYIYNINTEDRIPGANVWLQRPDGAGDWENAPVLVDDPPGTAIMLPNENPLTTNENGQYQWDTPGRLIPGFG